MIAEHEDGIEYGHAADCARRLANSYTVNGADNANDLLRSWIRRRLIKKTGDFAGRPVYSMADIYRVELATRRNGKRGRTLTKAMSMSQS